MFGSSDVLMTEERMTPLCSHQILVTTRTWCLNHMCKLQSRSVSMLELVSLNQNINVINET